MPLFVPLSCYTLYMDFLSRISTYLGASNPGRYAAGAFWMITTRILSMGVSLFAAFYIARTLGPQNFGELSYATSLISLLAFFSALASSTVITRDLVRAPKDETKVLGTSAIISFAGTITTILLVIGISLLLPHDNLSIYVLIILCAGQLFTPLQVSQNLFFATAQTKNISIGQFIVHITISLAKVLAMIQGQGVLVLASILFAEQLLSAFIFTLLYIKQSNFSPFNWHFDSSYAKAIILDSLPYAIIVMASTASARIDQVFIKHYLDTAAVGIYSIAVQLTEIWQVLPQMLLAAIYPALVNAKGNSGHYAKRIYLMTGFIGLYGLSAATITTLFAPYLIPLLYGEAFLQSINLVQIYIWSLPGIILGFMVTNILITENLRRVQLVTGLIPMFINIGLNFLWIPTYGAQGAAWATVASYSLAPLIPLIYYVWTKKPKIWQS